MHPRALSVSSRASSVRSAAVDYRRMETDSEPSSPAAISEPRPASPAAAVVLRPRARPAAIAATEEEEAAAALAYAVAREKDMMRPLSPSETRFVWRPRPQSKPKAAASAAAVPQREASAITSERSFALLFPDLREDVFHHDGSVRSEASAESYSAGLQFNEYQLQVLRAEFARQERDAAEQRGGREPAKSKKLETVLRALQSGPLKEQLEAIEFWSEPQELFPPDDQEETGLLLSLPINGAGVKLRLETASVRQLAPPTKRAAEPSRAALKVAGPHLVYASLYLEDVTDRRRLLPLYSKSFGHEFDGVSLRTVTALKKHIRDICSAIDAADGDVLRMDLELNSTEAQLEADICLTEYASATHAH